MSVNDKRKDVKNRMSHDSPLQLGSSTDPVKWDVVKNGKLPENAARIFLYDSVQYITKGKISLNDAYEVVEGAELHQVLGGEGGTNLQQFEVLCNEGVALTWIPVDSNGYLQEDAPVVAFQREGRNVTIGKQSNLGIGMVLQGAFYSAEWTNRYEGRDFEVLCYNNN